MVGDLWPPQRVGRLGPGAGVSMTTEVDVLLGRDGVDRLPEAIGPPISITVLMTGCLCAGDNDCVAISARNSDHPGVASVSGAATQFVLSLTALLSVASLGASMRRGVGPRKERSHSGRRFAPRWR